MINSIHNGSIIKLLHIDGEWEVLEVVDHRCFGRAIVVRRPGSVDNSSTVPARSLQEVVRV